MKGTRLDGGFLYHSHVGFNWAYPGRALDPDQILQNVAFGPTALGVCVWVLFTTNFRKSMTQKKKNRKSLF